MSLLSAENVSLSYGAQKVLQNVDLSLDAGEIVTIVGPNGSGKSTLLRVLIGALTPQSGKVHRAKKLKLGYVPQSLTLDPTLPLTVRRFLDLPTRVVEADAVQEVALF